MNAFDIAHNQVGESARRVVTRALDESDRRRHAAVTTEHILVAFARIEWEVFSQIMTRR